MSRNTEVSARFKDSIGHTNNWVTDIRWSNQDGVWSDQPLQLVSGTVTADSTSQVRWSCNLTVRGPIVAGSEQPLTVDEAGINPWSTHLQVRHGIEFGPGDRELIGMGMYRVDSVTRDTNNPGQVTIQGGSFESYLIDATFPSPRLVVPGDPLGRAQTLIREILPNATVWWDDRVDNNVWLPAVTVERDRWGQIDGGSADGSVARSLGARIYCDGNGVFRCEPVPTIDDTPTWTAATGPGGVLVTSTEQLTSDGVNNQIIASGESTSGSLPVGPYTVSDDDPTSRTYIWGRFGRRPMYYSSQNITTLHQLIAAANGILAPRIGLRQQITFDSLHDPLKEPGDVGEVTVIDGIQRAILDSVTYDLAGGNLQTQTRTTITLPGSQSDVPADAEGVDA